ncbi:AMP-binding protein [Bacillus sp. ISL-47]|uniref:AMP-binding protein n=1 Tax=Bacillus sp. ISL-47 TaxID=2819130 RepID=UPI001BE60542|nr:AMP-binding protein [Bacillus sp. ISL-47]MBT2689785.1 AMP-binding protein [Bacillus sp. ISL-47]MBT2709231.1 AMP-binding protein [Pseudomonas sp. ISL-84]
MNFNELLLAGNINYPHNIFLRFEEECYTYADMWKITNRLANGFLKSGIKKGDHVSIILSNRPEFIWSWFALAKIGAIAVTIDTRLKGSLLQHQLKNSESMAIITEEEFLPAILDMDIDRLIIVSDKEMAGSEIDLIHFNCLLNENEVDSGLIEYTLQSGWPLTIVYTSGTTGPAKGVVNPHETFVLSGKDIGDAVGMNQTDNLYLFLPLFHANPQLMGIPALLLNGATVVLGRKFSASSFWDTVNHYHVTLFTYVGTVLSILDKVTPPKVHTSLRTAYGGGAPEDIWRSLENKTNARIMEGYGMAEIGGFAIMNSLKESKIGSIGKPRELYDIRIFDDHDCELPAGEVGEIVVRPKVPFSMFTSYFNMEKNTLSAMGNLWFHTGDLAKKDPNGFFYFKGRKKNMIRRKGENISAYDIENIVQQHPSILENAVVPIPDEIAGQEAKLSVVCKKGEEVSIEELYMWLLENLPSHMVPRYLEIREAFEKTSSEKIKLQVLIDEGIKHVWDGEEKISR